MDKENLPNAVFLMGPTASGKSQLALELSLRFPLEIVSVDSAQVYRGMDIGTAKPNASELAAVRHHLIDIIDPTEAYSAARFREEALGLIHDIESRNHLPLLVGGTMLYFKALREGLSDLPQANAAIRAQIDREALDIGWHGLHAQLMKLDPKAGTRIKFGDTHRIQRALEIYRITGKTLSALTLGKETHLAPLRSLCLALVPADRAHLHRRIAQRMQSMFNMGLIEELRQLREQFALTANMPSMRCVGYRQVWEHLEGELGAEELLDRSIYATRQLAKRQLTWIRSTPDAQVVDFADAALADKASALIEHFIAGNTGKN
ncbi:MAG: tRNA (adenosine(37)-N6)-dimethylallyltransferase MiaA [Burkholderiales bacterium]